MIVRNTIVSILLAGALSVGCAVAVPSGRFSCSTADQCPSGWHCVEGLCVESDAMDGVDSGVDAAAPDAGADPELDAGPDGGLPADTGAPTDASDGGVGDAGAPRQLRAAHLVPDAPPLHVCARVGSSWHVVTRDDSLSFRGVSTHRPLAIAEASVTFAVYEQSLVGAGACPATTVGAILVETVSVADEISSPYTDHFTVAITGLLDPGTGEPPPDIVVLPDNMRGPTSEANAWIRVMHGVPNTTADTIDLCYDANASDTAPPTQLLVAGRFEEAIGYIEPAPIRFGALSIHASAVPPCTFASMLVRMPIPAVRPAGAGDNHASTIDPGRTYTIFYAGDATVVTPGVSCTLDIDCLGAGPSDVFCGPGGLCAHAIQPAMFAVDDTFGLF